ncbi:hypothetical protein YPC_1478 [Yersinia pestis biovar Medievalis str. Harbin 35]|nr:hypothetical protein YPC_1478 [Yersinia pestis biovar Medievalis str. Harbin 35]EEO76287.1 hypothetical protein YP516_2485 [Yersinia pestis Nepal516]EEO80479.1 hypothetical protein YPF_3301 [Yersinia pestis biovar Orientalis str. India 195]EEO84709.1 hypothetical protein YPH_0528 [Yersinia pestis biovar Orientalis str. PEXU2]EEO89658.1 hypothetical protein YPS_3108 [Yersinia pestis Pestoides A]
MVQAPPAGVRLVVVLAVAAAVAGNVRQSGKRWRMF